MTKSYPLLHLLHPIHVAIRKYNVEKARKRIRDNPEAIYEKGMAGAAHLDPYGVFKPSELLAQDEKRSPEQPKFSPGAKQILRLAMLDLDTLAGSILTEEDIISPLSNDIPPEDSRSPTRISELFKKISW